MQDPFTVHSTQPGMHWTASPLVIMYVRLNPTEMHDLVVYSKKNLSLHTLHSVRDVHSLQLAMQAKH